MPPSYSMMLPGRMSTPLIFMLVPVCKKGGQPFDKLRASGLSELVAPLALGLLSGKQRIGIDRRTLVPLVAGAHAVDREMEVRSGLAGIAGLADKADQVAALDPLALLQPGRIALEMGI